MRDKIRLQSALVLAFALVLSLAALTPEQALAAQRRLSIVLFPTLNSTGLEVWESKYYPHNVLEQKMTDYLETLLKHSPMIDVRALDANAANQWLAGARGGDDMAIQMEVYESVAKESRMIGTIEKERVQIRLKVFDARHAKQIATRTVQGKDSRFTFDNPETLFWLDAAIVGLPIPFEGGLDIFGLTGFDKNYKGQKMSRLTWDQFKGTSHWQAFKKAIAAACDQAMGQVTNVIQSNEPNSEAMGTDTFSPSFTTVGYILSPTEKSTRKRREYIISLGSQAIGGGDSVRVGEVLDVVRANTYITVMPDDPVVVIPNVIGRVKVTRVFEKNAVVVVVKDNKKEPITLKDMVIKRTRIPR